MNCLARRAFEIAACGALLLLSAHLFAQGCASCYTTAAAGGSQTAHALRSGILFLLFPPTLIFIGIVITLQRWKNTDRRVPDRNRRIEVSEGEEIT